MRLHICMPLPPFLFFPSPLHISPALLCSLPHFPWLSLLLLSPSTSGLSHSLSFFLPTITLLPFFPLISSPSVSVSCILALPVRRYARGLGLPGLFSNTWGRFIMALHQCKVTRDTNQCKVLIKYLLSIENLSLPWKVFYK